MTTECNTREFDFQALGSREVTARFDGGAITPADYRKATARDPRLPKLHGHLNKPPLKNRALQRHMVEVFVAGLLRKRNRSEARAWFEKKTGDRTGRFLGSFKNAAEALKFVEYLYQAGAVRVVVSGIYFDKAGGQFADALFVRLPKERSPRKATRDLCAQLQVRDLAGVAPDEDLGETHLYISMA